MIRPYADADLEQLLAAWDAASALAHPFLSAEFQAGVRRDIAALYLPNTETWVWEHDGRVVGFISMLGTEIGALFLDPAHHGQGIGRALTDHARARRTTLEVEVFKDNSVGRAFYDRYGFQLMRETTHEQTGLAVLRLRLPDDPLADPPADPPASP